MKGHSFAWILLALPLVGCQKTQDQLISTQAEAIQQSSKDRPSRWVLLANDTDLLVGSVIASGGQVENRLTHFKGVVAHISENSLAKIKSKHNDLKAVPDIEMHAVPTEDVQSSARPGGGGSTQPPQQIPWGLNAIGARALHSTVRGTGVKVCVVDTGIDKTHPDLSANIVGGRNFVVSRGTVDANSWNDDNGHGSHVAGTIAALDNAIGAVGVAPEAKLFGAKVLDKRGSGYMSAVADGVMECVNSGTQVINMSLGGSGDPNQDSPLKMAIEAAANAGVKIVVAAGNEGVDVRTTVPAGYPQVLAVAAVDSAGVIPSWSNFGLSLKDLTAPGVSVYSTWKGGTYNTISGTSMASPHVAGVMALVIQSGSLGPVGSSMGYSVSREGSGLVEAALSVSNK